MKQHSRAAGSAAKREYWQEQIQQWKNSGLSQAEFCRRNGLKPHQWWYWKKRLAHPTTPPVKFVRLDLDRIVEPGSKALDSTPLRLVFGNGFHLEVHKGFDPGTLEQVIRTLQRAGC